MKLISIAAIDEDRAIASENGIPWDLPEDHKHWVDTIRGHPVIEGRKTAIAATKDDVSIGNVTSNTNIVLTTQEDIEPAGGNVVIVNSVDEALEVADGLDDNEVYIIGGGEIYRQFMPYIDEMVLSHIDGDYDGAVYFPEWDDDEWEVVKADEREGFTIKYYERKNAQDNQ